ncbi:ABC transporter ATP-binding protein [Tateyamaria sp. ANG-S1]|uniref:ABC transporter ATP-binding protein n=1 Tax=Tateyamaria sp. ANG-S1 TaxID=1577905 RepID=UPI00057E65DA|nr:ABC transporter ATP-binding protein [Tateyamaria sp. ANG-S1]KIC48858.1 ABC transporter ATP-binding protein [Tateyamaria sp. ANG-S1]
MTQIEPVLHLSGVTKSYAGADGPVQVLHGVDLTLGPGETLALTGESGSGKSTLLHIAGGLETADTGQVHVAGQDLVPMSDSARAAVRCKDVAVVFQQFNLIPSLTVADNIAFQARLAGRVDTDFIGHLVARLGLSEQMRKYPEALSGGQQQRVAIARALAARPRVLLADEPTGNLDESTADDVLEQLIGLVADTGAGLLLVTHSPGIAARMDRRLHLRRGRVE